MENVGAKDGRHAISRGDTPHRQLCNRYYIRIVITVTPICRLMIRTDRPLPRQIWVG